MSTCPADAASIKGVQSPLMPRSSTLACIASNTWNKSFLLLYLLLYQDTLISSSVVRVPFLCRDKSNYNPFSNNLNSSVIFMYSSNRQKKTISGDTYDWTGKIWCKIKQKTNRSKRKYCTDRKYNAVMVWISRKNGKTERAKQQTHWTPTAWLGRGRPKIKCLQEDDWEPEWWTEMEYENGKNPNKNKNEEKNVISDFWYSTGRENSLLIKNASLETNAYISILLCS